MFPRNIQEIPVTTFKEYTIKTPTLQAGATITLKIGLDSGEPVLYYVNDGANVEFFFVECELFKGSQTFVCITDYSSEEPTYWLGLVDYGIGVLETITIKQQLMLG